MRDVFISSIIGYKNLAKNRQSQDYATYKKINNTLICAVADGHSTDFFEYSHEGAKFACESFIEILEKYVDITKEEFEKELSKKNIQILIYEKWMNLVNEHYKKNNPIISKTQYIKYSTTLLGCFITDKFIVSIKLGDGNIIINENNEYKKIIDINSGRIVNSLGRINAYESMYFTINNIDNSDNSIVLFTDGYENSFSNDLELFKSLDKTIQKYRKNIFSRFLLLNKYEEYLNKLSESVVHDDISIIFIL